MEKENPEIIIGLDIGTTKIAVVVGAKNPNGKLDIYGYSKVSSIGLTRGEVLNQLDTIDSIKKGLAEASNISNVDIRTVNIGIAGQHIRSFQHVATTIRPNPSELISENEIEVFIKSIYNLPMEPGYEIIVVMPQHYTIDENSDILRPVGIQGHQITGYFHVVIGKTAATNNIRKCVEASGCVIQNLFMQPHASSAAVLTDQEKEAGVVLVDIGGGTTDIAIFKNGAIAHTSVIPFAGSSITNDVAYGCQVVNDTAERLKVKYGSAICDEISNNVVIGIEGINGGPGKEITQKALAEIISARAKEIFIDVKAAIEQSGLENELLAGIVITGGGSLLANICHLSQFVTGLNSRVGYPSAYLASDNDKDINNPMYSTAIGLILLASKDKSGSSDVEEADDENDDEKTKSRKKPSLTKTVMDFFGKHNKY